MKPVTLGHIFTLNEIGSPYVARGEREEITDLFLAAFVCASDWRTSKRWLGSRYLTWFFAAWSGLVRKDNLAASRAELIAHLNDWCYSPPVSTNGKGKALTAPWHVRLYASLRHLFHMEHDEAMSLTVLEANALRAACGEDLGKLELRSQDSLDFVDVVKQLQSMPEAERDGFIEQHNRAELARRN